MSNSNSNSKPEPASPPAPPPPTNMTAGSNNNASKPAAPGSPPIPESPSGSADLATATTTSSGADSMVIGEGIQEPTSPPSPSAMGGPVEGGPGLKPAYSGISILPPQSDLAAPPSPSSSSNTGNGKDSEGRPSLARSRMDSMISIAPVNIDPGQQSPSVQAPSISQVMDGSSDGGPSASASTTSLTTAASTTTVASTSSTAAASTSSSSSTATSASSPSVPPPPTYSSSLSVPNPAQAKTSPPASPRPADIPKPITPRLSTQPPDHALADRPAGRTILTTPQGLIDMEAAALCPINTPGSIPQAFSTLMHGFHSLRGRRMTMEDTFTCIPDLKGLIHELQGVNGGRPASPTGSDVTEVLDGSTVDDKTSSSNGSLSQPRRSREDIESLLPNYIAYFAVFDGHGGKRAAVWAATYLHRNIVGHPAFLTNLPLAIREGTLQTDREWLQSARMGPAQDGSTSIMVLVWGDRLLTGNLGDSRATLCRGGIAVPLSVDHKPNRLSERIRIESAGGSVTKARYMGQPLGPYRVYPGGLAVSRAFGDLQLKTADESVGGFGAYVTADPEIIEEVVTPQDEFIVLASDGLWDVFTDQDAIDFAKKYLPDKPQAAAEALCREAFQRQSQDNVTVVVVVFHHNKAGSVALSTGKASGGAKRG